MIDIIKKDLDAALRKDPAATSKWQVFFTYSGFKAILRYRLAHWFYNKGFKGIARYISMRARNRFAIDIHPAAQIGPGFFIDHGVGVVIGETTVIGEDCMLFQGVTLGGTGKDTGKRHPTLGNHVMVSAGATILGPVTVGDYCKIGAGSVVLINVPPHCTVVGIPGRIVRIKGEKPGELDHFLPDPILEEFKRLNKRISHLEDKLKIHTCKYSIANQTEGMPIFTSEEEENKQ
jgi:serine O-acetyltransferase